MVNMNQEVKAEIVGKLDALCSRLMTYRTRIELYLESGPYAHRRTELELRHETQRVVREVAGLKPIVQRITGERFITLGDITWDPWLESFTSEFDNPKLISSIEVVTTLINEAIGRLESQELIESALSPLNPTNIQRPKVLIAHDGDSDLRAKLEMECWRMMLEPIVVEEQVSRDESVDAKVNRLLEDCSFAIVLARAERGVQQDSIRIPRGNIIDEIGRIRTQLGDRYIVLLEEGLTLPSNQSTGVVWESFTKDQFDSAVLKVVKSLRSHQIF